MATKKQQPTGMTVDEWVARHIAVAPPLNSAQLDLVRRVLRIERGRAA